MESPLREYLQIVRRHAWLIALVPLVAIGLTLVLLKIQPPVYRAAMTLVVGEPHGALPPVLGSTSVTRTMTSLLESDLVARSVIGTLGLDVTKEAFQEDLTVEVLPDTAVVGVSYDSSDQQLALDVVTELAAIFTRQLDETLGVQGGAQSTGSFDLIVRVFDAPHVEPDPRPQNRAQKLVIAGAVGLVLGLMLAVARNSLSARIWKRKDAEDAFGVPVVGTFSKRLRRRLVAARGAAWATPSLEALRARLQLARLGVRGPTVMITSASHDDSKTAVAANLAAALAYTGKRVVGIDACGGRPGLASWFGIEPEAPGLSDVLENGHSLEESLLPVELGLPSTNGNGSASAGGTGGKLEVLPAGTTSQALVAVVGAEAVSALLRRLQERADYVVVDCPPLLVPELFPLTLHPDHLLVVARCGRTTREQAEAVRETLENLGVEKAGVVLADAPGIEG